MKKPICNGFPKSGNHALVKACELLGVPASVEHLPYSSGLDTSAINLFIKRDPRNVLCSWLRWKGLQVTPGMFITHLKRWEDGRPFFASLDEYESWTRRDGVTVITYEHLIADDGEIQRIAAALGVPYIADKKGRFPFDHLPGHTLTWNAQHSDYQDIWTEQVQAEWSKLDGAACLNGWGY